MNTHPVSKVHRIFKAMLRKIYHAVLNLADKPWCLWALAAVSFTESSFFPIPPDVLLIPMVLARPAKAWQYALVCTVASVLGAAAGYAIGAFLFDMVAQPLLTFYGKETAFLHFQTLYHSWGWWIVLGAGFTPFPFKVITIASGLVGLNFPLFIMASCIARAGRFFLVAGLLWKFGAPIKDFIEKHLNLLTLLFFILLAGGFMLVR
jgi:membrane protein YqaA with SNARE-associated domain